MAIFIGTDPQQRKHKVFTESILDAAGDALFRVRSAYRFEVDYGEGTDLMDRVPGLGQLTGDDETTVWKQGINLIVEYYAKHARKRPETP